MHSKIDNEKPIQQSPIEKIMDFIDNGTENIVSLLFLIIVITTLLQVIFRYVFNAPLIWTEELARYVGIWMIMLATAIALKNKSHIGVDTFLEKLPIKIKRCVYIFNDSVTVFVMVYLSYYSFILMSQTFYTPSPAMRIPIGIAYLGMLLGCVMSSIFAVYTLTETIIGRKLIVKDFKGEGLI